jgi:hypothetical protein
MDKLVCRSPALSLHDPRRAGPGLFVPAHTPSLSDKADANGEMRHTRQARTWRDIEAAATSERLHRMYALEGNM